MRRLLFAIVTLALLLCAVGGCGAPKQPIAMQAYNASTGEPVAGASVSRWDWVARGMFGDGYVTETPDWGVTGHDGTVTSPVPAHPPSFIFRSPGFQPAEVRVDGDDAFVAWPSYGNRWFSRHYARGWGNGYLPPIRYQRDVPSRPLIRVPMWPVAE